MVFVSRTGNKCRQLLRGIGGIDGHSLVTPSYQQGSGFARVNYNFSDCFCGLDKVQNFLPYWIPSWCKHSNILKIIMVKCSKLSLSWHYKHVKAHQQDDRTDYHLLPQELQLDCAMDYNAKNSHLVPQCNKPSPSAALPAQAHLHFCWQEKAYGWHGQSFAAFWCTSSWCGQLTILLGFSKATSLTWLIGRWYMPHFVKCLQASHQHSCDKCKHLLVGQIGQYPLVPKLYADPWDVCSCSILLPFRKGWDVDAHHQYYVWMANRHQYWTLLYRSASLSMLTAEAGSGWWRFVMGWESYKCLWWPTKTALGGGGLW